MQNDNEGQDAAAAPAEGQEAAAAGEGQEANAAGENTNTEGGEGGEAAAA